MWNMVCNGGNHSLWLLREWGSLTFSITDMTTSEESIDPIGFPLLLVLVYPSVGTLYGRGQLRGQDHRSWASRKWGGKMSQSGCKGSKERESGLEEDANLSSPVAAFEEMEGEVEGLAGQPLCMPFCASVHKLGRWFLLGSRHDRSHRFNREESGGFPPIGSIGGM